MKTLVVHGYETSWKIQCDSFEVLDSTVIAYAGNSKVASFRNFSAAIFEGVE